MSFSVEHEDFSGPLGLLLDIVNSKELTITEVSLAKVADDFLKYLEENEVPSIELADFLLVASRLIYLKSRELMPYLWIDEEDAAAAKLEDQLRLYQDFIAVAAKLEERYAVFAMYARPFVRERQVDAKFVPAKNVTAVGMREAFASVLKRLEPFFTLQEASMERVKSVEERMDELKAVLASRAQIRFKDMVTNSGSKVEIVVSFLALLELLRRKHITASQEHHTSDIVLERV